jgi:hypothetical protein
MAKSVENSDGDMELVNASHDVGYNGYVGFGLHENGDGDAR